jgi:hypothetical protein
MQPIKSPQKLLYLLIAVLHAAFLCKESALSAFQTELHGSIEIIALIWIFFDVKQTIVLIRNALMT